MRGPKPHSELFSLPGWEEPANADCLKSELQVPGRGLDQINPSSFEVTTWIPRIDIHVGQYQFGKFVDSMMNRIRFQESNPTEIRNFVNLLASDENWNFFRVAVPRIPELQKERLHENENKNFQLALLFQQLKTKIHQRGFEVVSKKPQEGIHFTKVSNRVRAPAYNTGLTKAEELQVEYSLFGHYSGPSKTPGMERLVVSTMALGWPQAAVNRQRQEERFHGFEHERDSEGLPTFMLMPGQPRYPARGAIWPPPGFYKGTTVSTGDGSSQMTSLSTTPASVSSSRVDQENNIRSYYLAKIPGRQQSQSKDADPSLLSKKTTKPVLHYLQTLALVNNNTSPKAPTLPNIAPEPERVTERDRYKYIFNCAKNYPPFVKIYSQIARTNDLSKFIEAEAKAKKQPSIQALRPTQRPEMVGECAQVVLKTKDGWKTYYSPAHIKYKGVQRSNWRVTWI